MGNIGNLSGVGKMESGGGSNKLYCVTLLNKYSFYSSIEIKNSNDLKDYLLTKGSITIFGNDMYLSNTRYEIAFCRLLTHKNTTQCTFSNFLGEGSFSSGGIYQGGTTSTHTVDMNYSSITTISCYEV